MKRVFLFCFFPVMLNSLSAQNTFTFLAQDTLKYAAPGALITLKDSIINNSSTGYYVDVIRMENNLAPNWSSYFCIDLCYLPSVDSARFYLLPNERQPFLFDFDSDTSVPDSSTALMKFKNVSVPSNTFYQRFYGVTQAGLSVSSASNEVSVKIFPLPVVANSTFCFRISEKQNTSEDFTLILHDVCGKKSMWIKGLINGDNYLSLNLVHGIYVYSLLRGEIRIKTGKMAVSQ